MELAELLHRVTASLEALDIPYLVTGSMATIAYGEPRFTRDIDVVVISHNHYDHLNKYTIKTIHAEVTPVDGQHREDDVLVAILREGLLDSSEVHRRPVGLARLTAP